MGIITADMSNLEFLHLLEIKAAVPVQSMTQPSQDILNYNLLRWTFMQSAYLLPISVFAGAVLILQMVLYVGRLRHARIADGLSLTLIATCTVVGLTTLLNAYVGTYRIGVILTKMLAGVAVCSTLGLLAQAVEILPSNSAASDFAFSSTVRPAAVGFPIVMFATVYGVGSAFASCSIFGGYQLATILQRYNIGFAGIADGPTQGFRTLAVLQGLLMLVLCVIIGPLLFLSRRLRKGPIALGYPSAGAVCALDTADDTDAIEGDKELVEEEGKQESSLSERVHQDDKPAVASTQILENLALDADDKDAKPTLSARLSFYSLLSSINILRRNATHEGGAGVSANIRNLQKLHKGFGLWVSTLLQRIMVFIYGRMGVDSAAFDLISAGTSSRETFIAGVLIVSNTYIIQLAVVSLIEPIKADKVQQFTDPSRGESFLSPEFKFVPTLPGLPALAGGIAGAVSSILFGILAKQSSSHSRMWIGGKWRDRPWWVPMLLAICLVITIAGLGLAVVANAMVPTGDIGVWSIYAATIVTSVGSTPQLPLALIQIYTVLDAQLGRNISSRTASILPETSDQQQGEELRADLRSAGIAREALKSTNPTVHAVRWERVGVMISTLTTIATSELLTAWIFLLPQGAQMAFLFVSAVLAIGGCTWLVFRHTWPLRQKRRRKRRRPGQ